MMLGLDTETVNGRAVLICAWGGDIARAYWPRSGIGIMRWLLALPDNAVGWNASYDARAVIAWLPRAIQGRLALLGRAQWGDWRLRYIERKLFEVRLGKQAWRLYDAAQFFGGSLRRAAERWLPDCPKLDQDVSPDGIARALKTAKGRADLERYCMRDAELAARLWAIVDNQLSALGVDTASPVSPAALAGRYCHPKKVWPKPQRRESRRISRWGMLAYHGGRIEVWRRGYAPRAWEIDISSAYPAMLARLPHPGGLTWAVVRGAPPKSATMGIVQCRVSVPTDLPAGPLPVVVDGVLIYPVGEWCSYVDLWSYRMLQGQYGIRLHPIRGLYAWARKHALAYPQVARLYHLKQTQPGLRLAAKLLLNGLSGKLVQRDDGWREDKTGTMPIPHNPDCWAAPWQRVGPYYRPVAAAHVTGPIRARLWLTAMRRPGAVISMLTDAIWWSERPTWVDLPKAPTLGDWTMAADGGELLTVAAGVYSYRAPGADTWETAFRGFRSQKSLWALLEQAPAGATAITVPVGIPGTLRAGVARGNINEIGVLDRILDLNCDIKRRWQGQVTAGMLRRCLVDSNPWAWYHN